MTCAQAAEIFERTVEERRARSHGKLAMRYRQMERIAKRLREHAEEDRFTDDVAKMLPRLDALQLLGVEFALNTWWPAKTEENA